MAFARIFHFSLANGKKQVPEHLATFLTASQASGGGMSHLTAQNATLALELQSGACGAHRELLFSKDEAMGASVQALLLTQARPWLCEHCNPVSAA